jgi:hypothetical protein
MVRLINGADVVVEQAPDVFDEPAQQHRCGSVVCTGILGYAWVARTMKYIHVHSTRIEDAVLAGQERAAQRLEGLLS